MSETFSPKKARKRQPTYREKQFVALFKGNATEAAIAAGYKKSAARIMGSRLPCKLTRAFGPRNSMKIVPIQAIIQNGGEVARSKRQWSC